MLTTGHPDLCLRMKGSKVYGRFEINFKLTIYKITIFFVYVDLENLSLEFLNKAKFLFYVSIASSPKSLENVPR